MLHNYDFFIQSITSIQRYVYILLTGFLFSARPLANVSAKPFVIVHLQERNWNKATFVSGDGIKSLQKKDL